MKINKKKLEYLHNSSVKYSIPEELLTGIYIIETTYRKWYHRLAENMCTIISVLLNIFFKRKVKNYTIGRCQIGLTTILSLSGESRYRHSKKIDFLKYKDLKSIISGMSFRGSIEYCSRHLKNLYDTEISRGADKSIIIRRVGEEFNGRYIYGLLLENICNDLNL